MTISKVFSDLSCRIAKAVGSPVAFMLAAGSVVVWALTGPLFGFSETWQLVINTGTTIITFLMVFLIQNQQNRDSEAVQLKLDELLFAMSSASNEMIDIEKLDQKSLDALRTKYEHVLHHAEKKKKTRSDKKS
ncbi:low affinity iron permease family protein [Hydrocarboniphaga sp.]|uniref:low affinity iron permease family protein n=1 Tax=Hydrocarboniphaga sp. TaxID=2033016 RepID=UPI003D0C7558